MQYCKCRPFDLKSARIEPAPPEWQAKNAYVCSVCNRVHHAVQEPVTMVLGPRDARALTSAVAQRNGQHIITWAVGSVDEKTRRHVPTVNYYPWPRRNPLSDTEPIVFKTWKLLMAEVEIILTPGTHGEAVEAKLRARGMAEVIAVMLHPFMENGDSVVKAAVKKHNEPDYEVPGLGEHLWDPMRNPDGSPRTPIGSPASPKREPVAPKAKSTGGKKLSDDQIKMVKEGVDLGIFDKKQAARMFDTSIDVIESLFS